jgi:hypothetical protein
MIVKNLLLDYYNKRWGSEIRIYKSSEYHVSSLLGSCVKATWNNYMMKRKTKEHEEATKLLFLKGLIFHELLQKSSKAWDGVEVECTRKIKTSHGVTTLIGHADAVKDDTVYEFKTCMRIPYKPRFDHVAQVNAYATMLGKPRAIIVYAGSDGEAFNVKEFTVLPSEWHYTLLVNKLHTIHALLKTKAQPMCSCRNRQHDIEWLAYCER